MPKKTNSYKSAVKKIIKDNSFVVKIKKKSFVKNLIGKIKKFIERIK